jgi:transcriptional regulator with XRE-family HTH domain
MLGDIIRQARKRRGLSRRATEMRAGLLPGTLKAVECGEMKLVAVDALRAIAGVIEPGRARSFLYADLLREV